MSNIIVQPVLQRHTLQLYGEMLCRVSDWSGRLVMAAFSGAAGSGVSAAASLAGAVSLVVDKDNAAMKTHFRDGAFDFLVNTLDEALRSIKNEVRQGRPIAVGLVADPSAVLAEAAERGLAAAFVLHLPGEAASVGSVCDLNAAKLEWSDGLRESPELRRWSLLRRWVPGEVSDERALSAALAPEDMRLKWLKGLPAHQRSIRGHKRWCWLSEIERMQM